MVDAGVQECAQLAEVIGNVVVRKDRDGVMRVVAHLPYTMNRKYRAPLSAGVAKALGPNNL